jgi:hypothetical protein
MDKSSFWIAGHLEEVSWIQQPYIRGVVLSQLLLLIEARVDTENWLIFLRDDFASMLLWSSGQSSWLQIQKSRFNSRRYQIFWVVGLERASLSLVSTIEELLERKSSGSSLESREYGHRDPSHWPQRLALTSPTSGSRSVGIVRSRTQATEIFKLSILYLLQQCLFLLNVVFCFKIWLFIMNI